MGPMDPSLRKNKKIILQNFGLLAFFKSIIFCFLKKNNKRRSKTQQTYINNQNQEAFIFIIINLKLQVFLLCQNIIFEKIPTLWIKWHYFYFADRPTLFFCYFPRRPKINLALPKSIFEIAWLLCESCIKLEICCV